MTNLATPSPGDRIVAEHIAQFTAVLNSALGLTLRAQGALGRIEFPSTTSHPGSPANYQAWVRSDLGSGRIHMRNSAGYNVPYLPLRQVQKSTELAAGVNFTSTTLADLTGLALSSSIVTTGGRLRITIVPSVTYTADDSGYFAIAGSGAQPQRFHLVAVVGAVTLGEIRAGSDVLSASNCNVGPSQFMWDYQPAAGTYAVKIQARVHNATCNLYASKGLALLVEEWGD